MGDWKAVRQDLMKREGDQSIQLYNLKEDIGETKNVADQHPEIVQMMREIMKREHEPSEVFPFPALDKETES